ncbi:MAG: hypothetical protein ACXAC7_18475 [Candidatus Hodarchaeales archaeon]|jgi:hypothetical protein
MSRARKRRRTGARAQTVAKRRVTTEDESTSEDQSKREGTNFFTKLTVNTQVYYMKVIFGITSGILFGFLEGSFNSISGNWFFLPLTGLILIILSVRYLLNYSPLDLSWPKLLLLSGTFSLFISFIFTSSLVVMLFYPQQYSLPPF